MYKTNEYIFHVRTPILVILLLLAFIEINGQKKKRTEPAWLPVQTDKTTLGGRLEEPYSNILGKCTGKTYIPFKKKQKDKNELKKSAIPKSIQDSIGEDQLKEKVWFQNRDSLARLFSFAYENENVEVSDSPPKDINQQIFTSDFTVNPATYIPSGVSKIDYAHNCTKVLSAAMKASAGYTLPIASFKAAVEADYKGTNKTNLLLTKGTFNSPFGDLIFNQNSDSNNRLYAYFTLWNWYANGSIDKQKQFYLIRSFNGVVVFEGNEQDRVFDGDLSSSGKLGLPFGAVAASANFNIRNEQKIRITNYYSYAFVRSDGKADLQLDKLPKLQAVKDFISTYKTKLERANDRRILEQGITVNHRQIAEGIPKNQCNNSFWNPEIKRDEIMIVNVKPVNPNSSKCEFTVSFTPSNSLFTSSSVDDYRLNYNFTSRRKISNKSLILPAEEVIYRRSTSPEINLLDFEDDFGIADRGNEKELSWLIRAEITNRDNIVDWTRQVTSRDTKIVCNDNIVRRISPPRFNLIAIEGRENDRILTIRFSKRYRISEFDFTETMPCKFKGKIKFGRNNNNGGPGTIERVLPEDIIIRVPKVKPSPTPTIPPPTPKPTISPSLSVSPTASPTPPRQR